MSGPPSLSPPQAGRAARPAFDPSDDRQDDEVGAPDQRRAGPTETAAGSFRARVARSIFWIACSRGMIQLLQFATTITVARILVPADYGVMAIAGVCTGVVGMIAEMGLGTAIVQFRDLEAREIDTCFWITLGVAAVGFAVLALGAPTFAQWFAIPRLAAVLPVVALALPITACSLVSDSLLRKRLALDRVAQAEVIGKLVALPAMLAGAFAGWGVWALVLGMLTAPAARAIITCAFAPWRPGFRLGGPRVKEALHFSLTTLGVKVLWAVRESADRLIVGKIAGAAPLGMYSMAKELALLPGSKITVAVNILSSPLMAELQADVEAMRAAFYRAWRLTAAIAVPASAGIALVAGEMVSALLGPKWLPAIPLVRLLCLYAAVRSVDVLLPPVLFARHRERYLFWYCLVLLIVVPGAAIAGGLWGGAPGVVLFSTPVYCLVMTIMAREALRELRAGLADLWRETWPILAATAAMAAVVVIARQLVWVQEITSPMAALILFCAIGMAAYGAALFAIGGPVIGDGAEVLGWILRRGRVGA